MKGWLAAGGTQGVQVSIFRIGLPSYPGMPKLTKRTNATNAGKKKFPGVSEAPRFLPAFGRGSGVSLINQVHWRMPL